MNRFAPTALMLGNFVTGASVLAPAGMLVELSGDLGVTVRDASLLITFGAAVLCIGSPLTAWLTSRFDRRILLAGTLLFMSLCHLASAFAPNYDALLATRIVMLSVAALFTPQAAGTAALMAPIEKRGSTMSYVFLGWSLAAAVALPAVTYIASHYGWRFAHGAISIAALLSFMLAAWRLPAGLAGVSVDLKTWAALIRNPLVLTLLLITTLQMGGQFGIFTFIGPLLARTGATVEIVAVFFFTWGVTGFAGNLIASRVVDSWGGWTTSLTFTIMLLAGVIVWSLGAGALGVMYAGVVVWGFGFTATNSMQQIRLVTAAPELTSASVSLNTSALYVGQAMGSAVGGLLYVREAFGAINYVAVAFIAVAAVLIILTRPRVV